jgi:hypothetical protein
MAATESELLALARQWRYRRRRWGYLESLLEEISSRPPQALAIAITRATNVQDLPQGLLRRIDSDVSGPLSLAVLLDNDTLADLRSEPEALAELIRRDDADSLRDFENYVAAFETQKELGTVDELRFGYLQGFVELLVAASPQLACRALRVAIDRLDQKIGALCGRASPSARLEEANTVERRNRLISRLAELGDDRGVLRAATEAVSGCFSECDWALVTSRAPQAVIDGLAEALTATDLDHLRTFAITDLGRIAGFLTLPARLQLREALAPLNTRLRASLAW